MQRGDQRPVRGIVIGVALAATLLLLAVAPSPAPAGADGPGGKEPDPVEPRIVGGTVASDGEYPYQVALLHNPSQPFDSQYCGGSLIHPRWVLTAAHCTDGDSAQIYVLAGTNDLVVGAGDAIPVDEVHQNPSYTTASGVPENDFSLLELSRPVNTSLARNTLVPLVRASQTALFPAGTMSTATGWGSLSSGGSFPTDLREVVVPVVADATCGSGPYYGATFKSASMICAGATGFDTCQGDSGGPLVVNGPGTEWIQMGVTSWGFGCAAANKPGVYSRVSNFFTWIESVVGKPSNDSFSALNAPACPVDTIPTANTFATKEASEPNHASNAGGGSQWWRFTAPSNGTMHISTLGSEFDTILGVYTGASVGALVAVASNDDINGSSERRSRVNVAATAGTTYHIAVDGYNHADGGGPERGRVRFNFSFDPTSGNQFPDVPASNMFVEDIAWMANEGITTGFVSDCGFHPSSSVTRQSMAAFLFRLDGWGPWPLGVRPDPNFNDVPGSHAFYPEIAWMVDEGIAAGFSDGGYHPDDPVTRQSMAAFLYRMAGSPNGADPSCSTMPFSDVPISSPFCGEIKWMTDAGIASGFVDGTFRPANNISRQAMAAFTHNFSEL
jgi:secreted trypsin-like serine protease